MKTWHWLWWCCVLRLKFKRLFLQQKGWIFPQILPFSKFLFVAQHSGSSWLLDSPVKWQGIARALAVELYTTLEGKEFSFCIVLQAPAAPGWESVAVPEDLRSAQEQSRGVSSGKATPCHTRLIQGCPRGQDNPTCDLSRDIPTQVGIEKLFWDMQGWDSCNGISRDIPLW